MATSKIPSYRVGSLHKLTISGEDSAIIPTDYKAQFVRICRTSDNLTSEYDENYTNLSSNQFYTYKADPNYMVCTIDTLNGSAGLIGNIDDHHIYTRTSSSATYQVVFIA